jgi:hypothetical protein
VGDVPAVSGTEAGPDVAATPGKLIAAFRQRHRGARGISPRVACPACHLPPEGPAAIPGSHHRRHKRGRARCRARRPLLRRPRCTTSITRGPGQAAWSWARTVGGPGPVGDPTAVMPGRTCSPGGAYRRQAGTSGVRMGTGTRTARPAGWPAPGPAVVLSGVPRDALGQSRPYCR